MEELKERQENELEVIQAIYLDDVKDLREGGGFTWEPLTYSIRLLPQRGSSHTSSEQLHTATLLTLRIPRNYPNVVPEFTIDETKGLTNQEISELKNELHNLVKSSMREVMVLNLAQFVETYLYSHQKRPTGSFYDEMLMRKKRQEEMTIEKKQIFHEKERLAIQEEILKKQEALREEEQLRKEERRNQNETPPNMVKQISPEKEQTILSEKFAAKKQVGSRKNRRTKSGNYRRSSEESEESSSFSESSNLFNFEVTCQKGLRTFQRGEALGLSSTGRIMYAGMDCKTGSLVAISEWKLHVRSEKRSRPSKEVLEKRESIDDLVKHINSFETEFRVLQKLTHPNIVPYIGMKTIVPSERGAVILYVVEEFVRGCTLQSYLQENITQDLTLIRHCILGILRGLEYLHSNNVVHRFMRDTSIFMDVGGTVKISDYGLERKMFDLLHATNDSIELSDKFSPSVGRGAKKCDIYRVGVIILSLLKGSIETGNPPEIPVSLPASLQDFLKKFVTTDEHARWTATQLLEHPFLKLPMEKRKFDFLTEKEKVEYPLQDELDETGTQGFMSQIVKGHSRLQSEFEVLLWLGKGGFGDVVKVRNKLDGGIYALKRIRLNPRNKLLNKKITREVKLLSRLNHENVVRYFNSWIETVVEAEGDSTPTETPTPTTGLTSNKKSSFVRFKENPKLNSLEFQDNIEELAPPSKDTEWSISFAASARNAEDDESEDSSEDEDIFGTSFIFLDEQSDDIVFESDSNTPSSLNQKTELNIDEKGDESNKSFPQPINDESQPFVREAKFLYIQMEFCEKSTLRTAIDSGLHEDNERTWRLFREIIEGLVHIHQQGMIHRDLKPVNIFLDFFDHVKIGDFGLATSNVFQRSAGAGGDCSIIVIPEKEESIRIEQNRSADFGDDSLTGHVGTALYVAPELNLPGTKSNYNQKVDLYSLGIIFFEMFYRPYQTNMERVRAILGLRQEKVTFPQDYEESLFPQHTIIVRWLLNHDPSQRPTSIELLQSELLPPLEMEKAALQEVFRHTLSNPQSKAYKYLIHSCFKQSISPVEEITYDMATRTIRSDGHGKLLSTRQKVKQIIIGIFEKHGALELNTPLLLPKTKLYKGIETSVEVMTHGGSIVTIPHDIRVPFARYIVSNSFTNIKRYAIEKVFRERKVHGFHPREFYECAFDIISSSKANLLADAEVISSVFEIFAELPWLKNSTCSIRFGHTFLLDAIFIHFGIDQKFHGEIKTILAEIKTEKQSKSQVQRVQTHLVSLCLPDQFISHLFALMEIEGPLNKLPLFFKGILNRKGEAAAIIKEALRELEVLGAHVEAFGLKSTVVFCPSMIFGGNIYSGLTFQVLCNLKRRKNRLAMDIIAAGGRYDTLLETFRSTLEMTGLTSTTTKQFGVGVSISLDKLISGLELEEIEGFRESRVVEVVICSIGQQTQVQSREKISIMKDIWELGISCTSLDGPEFQTIAAAEEQCKDLGASFLVILGLRGVLKVQIFEKEKNIEKQITKAELIEFLRKNLRTTEGNELHGSSSFSSLNIKTASEREGYKSSFATESCTNLLSHQTNSSNNVPFVNITFVFPENKDKNSNWKRRHENLMMSHIIDILCKFSKQQTVELLGIDANVTLVKTLGSNLQIQGKEEYNRSVADILERHPRQKYVKAICDEIFYFVFEKTAQVIIIFGLMDNTFKVLL